MKTFKDFTLSLQERSGVVDTRIIPSLRADLKNRIFNTSEDFIKFLTDDRNMVSADKSKIGGGHFSNVYMDREHPEWVVKVEHGKHADIGFDSALLYAEASQKYHASNSLFPQVAYYGRLRGPQSKNKFQAHDGPAVVIMEAATLDPDRVKESLYTFDYYLHGMNQFAEGSERSDADMFEVKTRMYFNGRNSLNEPGMERFQTAFTEMFEILGIPIDQMKDFCDKIDPLKKELDMKHDNIAFRDDGSPVWIDPIWGADRKQ